MKKKLLLLADASNIHTIRWVKKALEWGFEVTVCSFSDSIIEGATVIHWNRRIRHFGKLDYLLFYFQLKKILREQTFDIVHAHYASSYGFIGALASPRNFIVSVWGSDVYIFPNHSFVHRLVFRYTMKKAKIICSTSKAMADEIRKYTPRDIRLTPFGVDTSEYVPIEKETLKKKNFVIGTIKRLERVYGIDTLIEAFAHLRRCYNAPLKLVIAGTGSDYEALKWKARELSVEKDVEFRGAVQQSEVKGLLNSFDIYAALSRSESFGVAVLEASSCEVPVVTSNVGGLPEVVAHEQTGLLVDPENSNDAALAFEKLLSDPKLRFQYGKNGREFVQKFYEWDKVSEIMHTIYRSLIH